MINGIIFAVKYSKIKSGGTKPMELMEKRLTSERRKYPRFNVDLPIKYSRTNLFFRYGRAANASEGGLLVYLPEEMGIGQHLALKLFFPSRSDFNTLETFVQVVWTGFHLRKDWAWDYRTGMRFVEISPEDTTKLKNFLVTTSKKPPYTA
jgi:c-di-GMP-binding flagellar brake protein YcgR